MTYRLWILLPLLLASGCGAIVCHLLADGDRNSPRVDEERRRISGCYAVSSPTLTIPPLIRLTDTHASTLRATDVNRRFSICDASLEHDDYLVEPRPISKTGRAQVCAYWRMTGRDTLSVIWTNGFSGVSMCLTNVDGILRGYATPFTDLGCGCGPLDLAASVTLTPRQCASLSVVPEAELYSTSPTPIAPAPATATTEPAMTVAMP